MKKKGYILYVVVFLLAFVLVDQIGGRIILYGIERFYGLNTHADVLVVGHSHIMLGVDKQKMETETGLSVAKYTREGVNLFDRYMMLKQYLDSPYSDSLKFVLYGVDQFSFVKDGLSENSYKLFYPFMDNQVIDQYVKDSSVDWRDYYTHKAIRLSRYSDALLNASIRGYRQDYSNYKIGTLDVDALEKRMKAGDQQYARKLTVDEELLKTFENTVELLTSRGIRLILVNTPVVDVLKEYDPEGVRQAIHEFDRIAESHHLVEYWDFNLEYDSDYSIFFDPIHLNPEGQKVITEEIVRRVLKREDD